MKTTTWINASALLAAVTIALGAASWQGIQRATILPTSSAPLAFTAEVSTEWLPAPAARNEIEQRSALLERFAAEYRIPLRVIDSASELRTRAQDGGRLDAPLARFARSFEFSVGNARDADLLRGTLATWSVTLQPAPPATASLGETSDSDVEQF